MGKLVSEYLDLQQKPWKFAIFKLVLPSEILTKTAKIAAITSGNINLLQQYYGIFVRFRRHVL